MSTWAADVLARLDEAGLRRSPAVLSSAQDAEAVIGGRRVVVLCSNNYLGLANDPRVVEASVAATRRWGAGSGASRLVSGTCDLHLELEAALAAHKRTEACVLFSSGYLANVGAITALVARGDVVCSDELNHASIIDGCRLSGATRLVYRHADAADARRLLRDAPAGRVLVVTDTVFSMDGDLAPVCELTGLCAERDDALLMVDEAHATGLLGATGAGVVEAAGLSGRVPVVMGTLSKSLGAAGGYVCGAADLVEVLRQRARTHVFDTAPPPGVAGAALEALRIVCAEPERRRRALEVASTIARELAAMGYEVKAPGAAVVPVMVGTAGRAVALSAALLERGVFVPAIRPPTVPPGTARLRVCAMATHTDEHVERVLESFAAERQSSRRSAAAGRSQQARPASTAAGIDERVVRAGGVFVTGTDTGVGKTIVTSVLAGVLSSLVPTGVLKAVQTGTDDGDDDAGFVASATGLPASRVVRGPTYGEPLAPAVAAARAAAPVDMGEVGRRLAVLRSHCELAIVEGAGGLLVPVTTRATMADLASELRLPVLVVARPALGTLNHTALTVEAARARGLEVLGIVLCDFPERPNAAEATNPAELERLTGSPILGVVPHVHDASPAALRAAGPWRSWIGPGLGGCFDRDAFLCRMRDVTPSRVPPIGDRTENG